jgi:hypothetical protein
MHGSVAGCWPGPVRPRAHAGGLRRRAARAQESGGVPDRQCRGAPSPLDRGAEGSRGTAAAGRGRADRSPRHAGGDPRGAGRGEGARQADAGRARSSRGGPGGGADRADLQQGEGGAPRGRGACRRRAAERVRRHRPHGHLDRAEHTGHRRADAEAHLLRKRARRPVRDPLQAGGVPGDARGAGDDFREAPARRGSEACCCRRQPGGEGSTRSPGRGNRGGDQEPGQGAVRSARGGRQRQGRGRAPAPPARVGARVHR